MFRWHRWIAEYSVDFVAFDIDSDEEAYRKVTAWTGHESVPTLVIAPDDGFDPIAAPTPLPPGGSPRGFDRGTMLTEPNPGQVAAFLERHGIPFGRVEAPEAPEAPEASVDEAEPRGR
jgi:hypothetical protein